MVILGLGSNVGDRISHLRHALQLLSKIPAFTLCQVSPVYVSDALLPDDAPTDWNMPFLNVGVSCNTRLTPHELRQQCKEIELIIGHTNGNHWGPRPIDIDILAWDDLVLHDEVLCIPHKNLTNRPFAFWPLADLIPQWVYPEEGPEQGKIAAELVAPWCSRFTGDAPLHTRQILQRIDTPQIAGIINVTPDSFSDGGKHFNATNTVQYAHQLVENGADILDIGAEASGPNAKAIDAETEWQRLKTVLKNIISERPNMLIPPKISVDTRHAEVAKKALDHGVDWINDVSGLSDPVMISAIASSQCDVVVMHQLGIPARSDQVIDARENPVEVVFAWAQKLLQELENKGIARKRIIMDIGIGFGKTAEQSLVLLKNIAVFRQLGVRLLVGHSRKSFLKLFTNTSAVERDIETMPISLFLAKQQMDYLRVHQVEMCARTFKVAKAIDFI